MKRCDICNDEFNPHNETTCPECKEQCRAVSFEMYQEEIELNKKLQSIIQSFISQEKAKGKAGIFQNSWKIKFQRLFDEIEYG